MLVQLMCGQARECLYEKAVLVGGEEELVLAQEAAHLSQAYHQVLVAMQQAQDYVPFSWLSLVQVKREHFRALADQHVAQSLLSSAELPVVVSTSFTTFTTVPRSPKLKGQKCPPQGASGNI